MLVFLVLPSFRKSSSAKGNAVLTDPNDPNQPGELIVNFGGFQRKSYFCANILCIMKLKYWKHFCSNKFIYLIPAQGTSTNYNVVDTDYENFAVVYSCNNKLFFKSGTEIGNIFFLIIR
jgi:hypothetical protein